MRKNRLFPLLTTALMCLGAISGCTNSAMPAAGPAQTAPAAEADAPSEEVTPAAEEPSAVTETGQESITLRFATSSLQEDAVILKLLEEFHAENSHITVELEESPGNDLITKINTDIMADNCPDVFTYWRPETKWDFDKYVELGAIADLTELRNSDYYKDMFPDYAWQTASMGDMIVGIPRTNFYTVFMVNKTLFETEGIELPTDWDKLVAAAAALHEKGYIAWCTDTGEGLDDASRLFNAVIEAHIGNERGLSLMQGLESWQDAEVIKALGYFIDVAKPGYAPEDSSVLDANTVVTKYLNTGRAGMIIQNAGQVWNNMPFEVLDDFETFNFPLTPDSKVTGTFNELDLSNLVYASSKGFNDPAKKDAIIALIQKLTSPEAAVQYAEEDLTIVPHLNVTLDPAKIHPIQSKAQDLAYTATSAKWMLSFTSSDVVDEFRLAINGVWFGEFESPELLAQRLDEILFGTQTPA